MFGPQQITLTNQVHLILASAFRKSPYPIYQTINTYDYHHTVRTSYVQALAGIQVPGTNALHCLRQIYLPDRHTPSQSDPLSLPTHQTLCG